jgi:hypothetical protein
MSTSGFEGYQALAADMNELLHARVEAATPVATLSERGNKLLQVMEGADDQKFVTRSYTEDSVTEIEKGLFVSGIEFSDAWEMLQRSMAAAEIPIVQSSLLEDVNGYPFVIVSEYIEGKPLSAASQEVKEEVAHGLGRLMVVNPNRGFVPHRAVLHQDMFVVGQRNGRDTAILTDVDPYMHIKPRMKAEKMDADYIERVGALIWDEWCSEDEEERQEVLGAFIVEIADVSLDNFGMDSPRSAAFERIRMMHAGLDPRQLKVPLLVELVG